MQEKKIAYLVVILFFLGLAIYFAPEIGIKWPDFRSFFPSRPSSSQSTISTEVKLPTRPVKVRVVELPAYQRKNTFSVRDTVGVDETVEVRIPSGYKLTVKTYGLFVSQWDNLEPKLMGLGNENNVPKEDGDIGRLLLWLFEKNSSNPKEVTFDFEWDP